jgi:hypothetical protein
MASRVLCESEALHLDHHLLKSGDSAHISISKVMHFVQRVELLNAGAKGCTKDQKVSRCKSHCYSILFYSILKLVQFETKSHHAPQLQLTRLHCWDTDDSCGMGLLSCYHAML